MERATCARGGCDKLGSTCLLACLSPFRFNSTTVKHFCYDRDSCGGPPQQWEIERFRDALQKCMQVATGVWGGLGRKGGGGAGLRQSVTRCTHA